EWMAAAQSARARKPPEDPPPWPSDPPGLELFWQIYNVLLSDGPSPAGVSVVTGQDERFYPVDISPKARALRERKWIAGYQRKDVHAVHGWPVGGRWRPLRPQDVLRPKSVSRMVNRLKKDC